jgi:hypothetical protein
MTNPFQNRQPDIAGNQHIRTPQREAFQALVTYANDPAETEREVGIVLPVGSGKSGTITLAPFAFRSSRTLVVAPGVSIASQLESDFNPTNPRMFYQKCHLLDVGPYPEPVETSTQPGLRSLRRNPVTYTFTALLFAQSARSRSSRCVWISDATGPDLS